MHNSQLLLGFWYCRKLFFNPLFNILWFLAHNFYIFFDFFDIISSKITYCVGNDTFRVYNYFFKKKVSRINNFLFFEDDISKINKRIRNNKKIVILMVSRLEPLKWIADSCVILGRQKSFIEKSLKKKVEIRVVWFWYEANIIKKIKWINFLWQLPENKIRLQLRESDLFILPSYHDNFPTTLLEWMYYGNLLLIRRSSGEGKYLLHNSEQLFSYLEELPKKIVDFLLFPERIKQDIINRNRNLVKLYTHDSFHGNLFSIFHKLGWRKF